MFSGAPIPIKELSLLVKSALVEVYIFCGDDYQTNSKKKDEDELDELLKDDEEIQKEEATAEERRDSYPRKKAYLQIITPLMLYLTDLFLQKIEPCDMNGSVTTCLSLVLRFLSSCAELSNEMEDSNSKLSNTACLNFYRGLSLCKAIVCGGNLGEELIFDWQDVSESCRVKTNTGERKGCSLQLKVIVAGFLLNLLAHIVSQWNDPIMRQRASRDTLEFLLSIGFSPEELFSFPLRARRVILLHEIATGAHIDLVEQNENFDAWKEDCGNGMWDAHMTKLISSHFSLRGSPLKGCGIFESLPFSSSWALTDSSAWDRCVPWYLVTDGKLRPILKRSVEPAESFLDEEEGDKFELPFFNFERGIRSEIEWYSLFPDSCSGQTAPTDEQVASRLRSIDLTWSMVGLAMLAHTAVVNPDNAVFPQIFSDRFVWSQFSIHIFSLTRHRNLGSEEGLQLFQSLVRVAQRAGYHFIYIPISELWQIQNNKKAEGNIDIGTDVLMNVSSAWRRKIEEQNEKKISPSYNASQEAKDTLIGTPMESALRIGVAAAMSWDVLALFQTSISALTFEEDVEDVTAQKKTFSSIQLLMSLVEEHSRVCLLRKLVVDSPDPEVASFFIDMVKSCIQAAWRKKSWYPVTGHLTKSVGPIFKDEEIEIGLPEESFQEPENSEISENSFLHPDRFKELAGKKFREAPELFPEEPNRPNLDFIDRDSKVTRFNHSEMAILAWGTPFSPFLSRTVLKWFAYPYVNKLRKAKSINEVITQIDVTSAAVTLLLQICLRRQSVGVFSDEEESTCPGSRATYDDALRFFTSPLRKAIEQLHSLIKTKGGSTMHPMNEVAVAILDDNLVRIERIMTDIFPEKTSE
jgi:hypothetical protein